MGCCVICGFNTNVCVLRKACKNMMTSWGVDKVLKIIL
jgi:hypothetical protein